VRARMQLLRVVMLTGALGALAACGASAPSTVGSSPPTATPPSAGAGAEQAEADEHRHGHHGGVAMLIAMSIRDLDLTPDQKASVEKIRTDLIAKMEPARAAGKDLTGVLADGVAAGAVDRAKADAAIDKLVAAAQGIHDATADAMNQLHAALNATQRAALVAKLQEHFEKWKEANGHEDQDGPNRSGPLLGLAKDLNLTQDQAQKIKASFREIIKSAPANPSASSPANVQDHQHKEVADHMQAFATAFKADTFDAHSLTTANAANGHMARWAATRRARWLEAAAPVLTPDQRTKLAGQMRERASRQPT